MQSDLAPVTYWADVRASLLDDCASASRLDHVRKFDTQPSAHAILAGYATGPSSRHLAADGVFEQSGNYTDSFLASNHTAYQLEPDLLPAIGLGEYPPNGQGNSRVIGSTRQVVDREQTIHLKGIFGIPSRDAFADYITLFCISLGWTCYHCGMPAVVRCSLIKRNIPSEHYCFQVCRFAETVVCHACWEASEPAPYTSLAAYLQGGIEYRSALHYELGTLVKLLQSYTTSPRSLEKPPTGLMTGIRKMHSIYLAHGLPLATAAPAAPLPPFVLERDCHGEICSYKMDPSSRVRTYSKQWRESADALNCSAPAAQWAVFAVIAFDGYDRKTCALDSGTRPVSLLYSKYKKLNTKSLLTAAGRSMDSEQVPTHNPGINTTVASRITSDMIHFGSKTYLKSRHASACHALTPVVALWRSHSDGQVAWIRQAYAKGDTLACSLRRAFIGLAVLALASCCGDQVDTGLGTPYWTIGLLKGPDCLCVSCVRLVRTVACYVLGTYGYGTSRVESLAPYGAWIKAYLRCAPVDVSSSWKEVAEEIVAAWEQLRQSNACESCSQ